MCLFWRDKEAKNKKKLKKKLKAKESLSNTERCSEDNLKNWTGDNVLTLWFVEICQHDSNHYTFGICENYSHLHYSDISLPSPCLHWQSLKTPFFFFFFLPSNWSSALYFLKTFMSTFRQVKCQCLCKWGNKCATWTFL